MEGHVLYIEHIVFFICVSDIRIKKIEKMLRTRTICEMLLLYKMNVCSRVAEFLQLK